MCAFMGRVMCDPDDYGLLSLHKLCTLRHTYKKYLPKYN